MMNKRIISFLLALTMLFGICGMALPVTAEAAGQTEAQKDEGLLSRLFSFGSRKQEDVSVAAAAATGWSGEVQWTLSDDGVMTVYGKGAMKNYKGKTEMPWYKYLDQITEVVIEEGVTSIGSYAFYGLAITSVEIPESVTAIGDYAFKNVSRLKDVALPAGLTTLGDSAFYGIGTEQLTIPESVTSIGAWCFARSSIQAITFEGDAPAIGEGAFNKISLTARYPGDHATWTSAVMQNYGGRIHWSEK